MKPFLLFFLILLYFPFSIFAQGNTSERVSLKLKDAERIFVENNLLLLAGKFEIDVKKAAILQAGLYANPNIFYEQNVFNDKTGRYFDSTRHGQTVVQIQQLFLLGGKIDKRIKVAEINKRISEQQFFDLLRALTMELRMSFYKIHYLNLSLDFYDKTIEALKKTVELSDRSYQRRAILLSEVLRLKALLFFLESERTEVLVQKRQAEASLRVLLNRTDWVTKEIVPDIEENSVDSIAPDTVKLKDLLEIAYENRPDLRAAIQQVKYEEANLDLQHANAIPDLAFGPVYNRGGTYIPNYFGITASITVPLFDRNQGNIEAAEKAILSRRTQLQNIRLQIENEVAILLTRATEKNKTYQTFKNSFTDDYKNLAVLMIQNYERRYLTIIEFADFLETYRSSIQNMIKLQTERMEAIENLNYAIGKTILKAGER